MSTVARLTLEQYDQMIVEGYFDVVEGEKPRIELAEGELLPMSPIGPRHETIVDELLQWSVGVTTPERVRVRVQNSIALLEVDSVPQPDIAWVEPKNYRRRRPSGTDVPLIVEVADSSLIYDCGRKADLYASAGVKDYWVVDLLDETLIIFRDPADGRYQSLRTLRSPEEARPLAYPEIALPVSLLFPDEYEADSSN